jgi:hypothetical protein
MIGLLNQVKKIQNIKNINGMYHQKNNEMSQ